MSDCPQPGQMGYMQWHYMAERLTKKGQKQSLCATCNRWKFRCEADQCPVFRKAPPETPAQKDARLRKAFSCDQEDSGNAFPMDGTDRDASTEASDYNPPQIDEP